jgi:poly(ribitol-phosphate) beta-N-acetylglucosaminyltransferase
MSVGTRCEARLVRRGEGSRPDADGVADRVLVSVVVPVWNVEAYLLECLDSVVAQTIGLDRLEIIAVDDGSTDGSAAMLDEYAARYPQVVVVHGQRSGGPGRPRNLGLDRATGTFVFFLDADDYLGVEALARMVAMATRNETDVVLGKMVGFDGRRVPTQAFRRNRDRANVADVFSSLSVLKLFRRSVIERLALRFEEGLAAHEDGLFTVIAYLEADGISVVADYPCYFVRLGNRRGRSVDLVDYLEVIRRRIHAIETRVPSGVERDHLMRRPVVDVLRAFSPRWAKLEPGRRRQVFELGAQMAGRLHASARSLDASPGQSLRLYCLEHGLQSELEDIARCPAEVAIRDPIVERNRRYARYPHFRDGTIPDGTFEIRSRRFDRVRVAHELRRMVARLNQRRRG